MSITRRIQNSSSNNIIFYQNNKELALFIKLYIVHVEQVGYHILCLFTHSKSFQEQQQEKATKTAWIRIEIINMRVCNLLKWKVALKIYRVLRECSVMNENIFCNSRNKYTYLLICIENSILCYYLYYHKQQQIKLSQLFNSDN